MSYDTLRVALLQHDISWADVGDNILTVADKLNRIDKKTDLVILPELFSTAFVTDVTQANDIAEPVDGKTVNTLIRWSMFFGFAIAGTILIKEGYNLFNRGFLVEPSGEINFYDKHNLFRMGGENKVYTRGKNPIPIIRYRGWDIALAICYDLRFGYWLLNRDCKYDLLVIPANWPESRIYAWKHLLIARAIENVAFVAGCNRKGSDDMGFYPGGSLVADFKGKIITKEDSDDDVLYATLNKRTLLEFRNKFPVWKDFE